MAFHRTLNLSLVYVTIWLLSRDLMLTQAGTIPVEEKQTELIDDNTLAEIRDFAIDDKDLQNPNNEQHSVYEEEAENAEKEDSEFNPLPFPVNFWFYDVNVDGQITLDELIETTGDAEDVKKAFEASDRNSDGTVTLEEYNEVPWGYNPDDVFFDH